MIRFARCLPSVTSTGKRRKQMWTGIRGSFPAVRANACSRPQTAAHMRHRPDVRATVPLRNGHPIVKDERLVIGRSRHWDRPGSSSPNVADCRRWRPGSIRRQLSLSTDSHSRPKPIIKLFRQRSFARPVRLNDGADCVRCTWVTRGYF